MWTRSELKEKAKPAFKANYWASVAAAVVMSIFTAASSSSRRDSQSSSSQTDGSAIGMAGVYVMIALLSAMVVLVVIAIVKIIIGNALIVGAEKIFINNEAAPNDASFNNLLYVFNTGCWKNVAITMFLKGLFTWLWTLLFIIPGIVKGYEYKMIPFLLAENPDMDYKEAFARSKEMMNGQKWNTFVLELSFIGWFILDILTLGILGVFYVHPYIFQTEAELYLTLKNNA